MLVLLRVMRHDVRQIHASFSFWRRKSHPVFVDGKLESKGSRVWRYSFEEGRPSHDTKSLPDSNSLKGTGLIMSVYAKCMGITQALCLGSRVSTRAVGPCLTSRVPERGTAVWSAVATRQSLKVSRALSTSTNPSFAEGHMNH